MKVNIKNKEIELKYSFRSFIIYENIMGEPFQPTGKLTEFITLFYSTIMASSKDIILEYNEFLSWLDDNPTQLNSFTEWLSNCINQLKRMTPQSEETNEETDSKN